MTKRLRSLFERVESGFDAVFGSENNPLYHLGALGWFFYWIVAVSGIYLYVFFDTGVTQAYASVEYMTHTQWYAAGVARSLHRYASDALVIVMLLHLVREYAKDRLRGPRWFAWVIGVAILWLVFASGITGYWIVWDKLAQYVAVATSEWLDVLPIFGQSIARNFIHDNTLSGRFFTLMVFIHIAVPLILLFILWVHIQRITKPRVNPPRYLVVGSLISLTALSLLQPAVSQGPAELSKLPSPVGLDWFYMALYPLLDLYSGTSLWVLVGGLTLVLVILPWLPPARSVTATVALDNCNGCGRCVADCPYGAVKLQPRTDEAPYAQEAVVNPSRCVSCGICVGACPTATPFRRRSALVSGIDLDTQPVAKLRESLLEMMSALTERPRILVVGCEPGVAVSKLADAGTAVMNLNCVGQLPPSFIDFALSGERFDGVLLTGCRDGACHHRFGIQWTEQRIASQRDPYLRRRVPRERVEICWAGSDGIGRLQKVASNFRERLQKADMRDSGATVVVTMEQQHA